MFLFINLPLLIQVEGNQIRIGIPAVGPVPFPQVVPVPMPATAVPQQPAQRFSRGRLREMLMKPSAN